MRLIFLLLPLAVSTWANEGEPRIRTIAGDGTLNPPVAGGVAEGGPAAGAFAVAFDGQNRLYSAHTDGLWRINADGRWEHLWTLRRGGLPFGVAVDPEGRTAYVSDLLEQRVTRIDLASRQAEPVGAEWNSPMGLALDAGGNLYVSEADRIRVVTPEGLTRVVVAARHHGSLALDSSGNLYLTDFVDRVLRKIVAGVDGSGSESVAAEGAPLGVTVCPANDRLIWTDTYRVLRQSAEGPEVIAGSMDREFAGESGPAREARFVTPLAVACDGAGRIVVIDGPSRFRLIE